MLKLEPVEVKQGLSDYFQLTDGRAIQGLKPTEGGKDNAQGKHNPEPQAGECAVQAPIKSIWRRQIC